MSGMTVVPSSAGPAGRSRPLVLEADEVWVRYGDFAAVQGISITVERGGAVGVVGANGAGKSSLLRALAGLQPVASGRVRFHAEDGRERREGRRTAWSLARSGLRLVPEGREIFGGLSVRENLAVGAMLLPGSEREAALAEMLELFPRLAERSAQRAASLSGGEQQMLAVARACVGRPRLLMLDEPSLGLAPKVVHDLRLALENIRATGMAILISDQGLGIVRDFCEEVHVCRLGKVLASGPVEILHGDVLSDAFLT